MNGQVSPSCVSYGPPFSRQKMLESLFDADVLEYIRECVVKRMGHPNDLAKVQLAERATKQLGIG